MLDIKGKNIVVVGAGKTGRAVTEFLLNKGANVVLNDKNEIKENLKHNRLKIIDKTHPEEIFDRADLIVVSPGVNIKTLPIKENKKVIGDIELFYYFNKSKIIAITGTNGKTTTTTLVGEILKKKYKTFVGGNIGIPAIKIFNEQTEYDYSVLELSSFQLEGIKDFTVDIGVLLDITPDHLDRYDNFNEYVNAKLNILKNRTHNQVFIANHNIKKFIKDNHIVFYNINNVIFENKLHVAYMGEKLILDIEKIKLTGKHFYEDIYVAALIGLICNVDEEDIKSTIYNFNGLEHRLEFVLEKNGVKFFNDSKSTTISSTCKAIESFKEPVILILGGIHKGEEFSKILKYKNLKKVIAFGKSKEKILKELQSINPLEAESLNDAVNKAKFFANSGDIVLFSPACASFDMFENFEKRGKFFKELVNE